MTPFGQLNFASDASPSANPCTPLPASVETCPATEIFRIRKLKVSATNKFPDASIAMPEGPRNFELAADVSSLKFE